MEALLMQLAAAFATGNRVLLADSVHAQKVAAVLRGAVQVVAQVDDADVSAVLYAGPDAEVLRQKLARRDGALIPLLLVEQGGYNLHRLVVERAVSVNTTAAGGNASLMSIGD